MKQPQNRAVHCKICQETIPATGDFKQHLIDVHGYVREGGQVFKKEGCSLCSKPAFYRFGPHKACNDHKAQLQNVINGFSQRYERDIALPKEKHFDSVEHDRKLIDNKNEFTKNRNIR